MEGKKELIGILAISAGIGCAVGGVFGFLAAGSPALGAIQGSFLGLLIGFLSQYAFTFVYLKFSRRPAIAFLVVFAVIAAGTSLYCAILGAAFPFPSLAIVLISEIAGLAATFVIFNHSNRMNRKLRDKQRELEQQIR